MINWFKKILGVPEQKKTASIAKERLMVIVAHERGEHPEQPDFLPLLQKELTEVIAKYVRINKDQVQVEFEQRGGRSVLELNITLPEGQEPPSPLPIPEVVKRKRGRPRKVVS